MLPKLENCTVAIIGLGYVGLPLALEIGSKTNCLLTNKKLERLVFGYDTNPKRIEELEKGFDNNKIFSKEQIKKVKNIKFVNDNNLLRKVDVFIITVPTPINTKNEPNLSYIKKASKMVGALIKDTQDQLKNPIIIFESTVYPGLTEEFCIPLIEKESSKKHNSSDYKNSFYCGYSPERINPGDTKHNIDSITKVTSGCNKKVSKWINSFYGSFISAGTFQASSIKVAEAAKIIENTQRDINIALINELAILFNKLNINTYEVLNAASTKWNFHKYMPGLVGGHCIGVDPYYLTFKAKEIGHETKLIAAGRIINDYMHHYLFNKIIFYKDKRKVDFLNEQILLLGLSYKSNCGDIRNSQLINLVKSFKERAMNITIVDPKVDAEEVLKNTGLLSLSYIPKNEKYTIIIFALDHDEFKAYTKNKLLNFALEGTLIFDLTNNLDGEDIINL
tara:strand:- start:4975 stop:6321 length:1347 start_codon:yes stop_codon:yes gene_type:complete